MPNDSKIFVTSTALTPPLGIGEQSDEHDWRGALERLVLQHLCPWCNGYIDSPVVPPGEQGLLRWNCPGKCNP